MIKILDSFEDEIKKLYIEEHLSTLEIGELFGVSYATVNRLLKSINVPLRKCWRKPERKCYKCKKVLPLSEFYRSGVTGRQDYMCKLCNKVYNKDNPVRINYRLKKTFNINLAQYQLMVERQGERCAICGKEISKKRLSVDHDHKTGKIRGLLCRNCNTGLGMFCDDIEVLNKAIEYLAKPPSDINS